MSASFAAFDAHGQSFGCLQCVSFNQKNGFFLVSNGANSRLAFNVYRNLDLNALAALNGQQVDVLQFRADCVTLDVLDHCEV